MSKKILDDKILKWSKKFVKSLNNFEIVEIICSKNLSIVNSNNIKKIPNYGIWDFTPDFALIVKNINDNKLEIILINRNINALGLRSIGEIMCFNKIINPIYSFLISKRGHSNEISYFMINENLRTKLISYNEKSLIIFSFNDNNEEVNRESIIPFSCRDMFNDKKN